MTQILICLLVLLFSLSGPAMGQNAHFRQSSLAAEGGTTTLFRTVSDAEVKSINASEQYTAYNTEGKYFYPTAEQAQAQAMENYAARQGPETLTSVTVPNSVLKGGQSINPLGEGPAFFFPTEQLPQLGKPTVWNFWPLH